MKTFILACTLALSVASPLPDADAKADPHGILVPALAAVPVKQLQWPGVSAPGVDSTCFGCRAHALVPVIGRKRRSADAEAEADADAELMLRLIPMVFLVM